MKIFAFLASNLIRALILGLVGVMGVLGFLMLCPFPAFWRELFSEDRGYETK